MAYIAKDVEPSTTYPLLLCSVTIKQWWQTKEILDDPIHDPTPLAEIMLDTVVQGFPGFKPSSYH